MEYMYYVAEAKPKDTVQLILGETKTHQDQRSLHYLISVLLAVSAGHSINLELSRYDVVCFFWFFANLT